MPGQRTAQELVAMVRDHIQHPYPTMTPWRDGFPDDAIDPETMAASNATPILRWVNKAYSELLETGIAKCVFTLTLTPGQAEYGLVQEIHEITHVTLNGAPLAMTSLLRLDSRRPGWQAYPSLTTVGQAPPPVQLGKPTTVYTVSDIIGFDPAPDLAYVVQIFADDVPGDMVQPTDTPTRVPARYQDALASRAAVWICNMDAENSVSAGKIAVLQADWKGAYDAVQRIVQERQWDGDGNLDAGDYRQQFVRGAF